MDSSRKQKGFKKKLSLENTHIEMEQKKRE